MHATNLTLIPDYWTEMWTQNGMQTAKSELAIFGKRCVFEYYTLIQKECT